LAANTNTSLAANRSMAAYIVLVPESTTHAALPGGLVVMCLVLRVALLLFIACAFAAQLHGFVAIIHICVAQTCLVVGQPQ
jgi:hypothetical protein